MVVLGPHFWTIRAAAEDLIEAQAARVVDDEDGLVEVMAPLLEESLLREAGGAAARKIVDGYRGASERTASAIAKQILGSPAKAAGRSGASDD
jgi:3-deoxy-D-manno-octulosonic-acid transferase